MEASQLFNVSFADIMLNFPELQDVQLTAAMEHGRPDEDTAVEQEGSGVAACAQHDPENIPQPPSPAFFEQIKPWIDECGSQHGPCPMLHADPSALPTRVLKINPCEDGSFRVQLHEAKGEKARYTTLSHCWGSYRPIITTNENLDPHLRQIEWHLLPQTFQDAAIITHGLGLQYLWIDSLCIIQDDEADWKRESSQMHGIYSQGYLNIAAATGHDSRHGLFPSATSPQPFQCRRGALTNDDNPTPLATRAWVVQERLLSARTLHFYPDEIVMECSNCTRCQCSGIDTASPSAPDWAARAGVVSGKAQTYETLRHRYQKVMMDMFGRRLRGLGQMGQMPQNMWDLAPRLSFEDSNKSLELWDDILHLYCRKKITFLKDRVTALTGIAGAFGSTGAYGAYYAGLWEVWFVHMLLWYVDIEDVTDDLVPMPYSVEDPPLSPSWSWAKVRGSWVYRRPPVTRSRIELAEQKTAILHVMDDWEKFGAVDKAVVSVEGWVMEAEVQYEGMDEGLSYAERFRQQKVQLVSSDFQVGSMTKDFVLGEGPELVMPGDKVQLLAIVATKDVTMLVPGVYAAQSEVRGVVLRGVEGVDGVFTRIGVFQCGDGGSFLPRCEKRMVSLQ